MKAQPEHLIVQQWNNLASQYGMAAGYFCIFQIKIA